ncbi:MAG: hypothetical protein CMM94_03840 [Rickettsiales bacterium]|nr:hypothetical protein [Rickettsiales bacterium]
MTDNNMPHASYSRNFQDEPRKVGIELEFIGVSIDQTADLISDIIGGSRSRANDHVLEIEHDDYGTFRVELDSSLMQKLSDSSKSNGEYAFLAKAGHAALSPILSQVVPVEIVTPPLPIEAIDTFEDIVQALRSAGAKGTSASQINAFGVHFNPDIPDKKPETILAFIQAFGLLYPMLKESMETDLTREVTPFISPYPKEYVSMILHPDYAPNWQQLIDHYIQYNPTRDRALDMLPLFAWIEEDRVRSQVESHLIKARPTFHFRMPNSRVDEPDWSINKEWRHWLEIEALAFDDDRRREMAEAYHRILQSPWPFSETRWREQGKQWVS